MRQNGGREREPRDVAQRIFLPQAAQQRRGANDIADGAELDDQQSRIGGGVGGAAVAVVAVRLVRCAGQIAAKMAAVGVEEFHFNYELRITNYELLFTNRIFVDF